MIKAIIYKIIRRVFYKMRNLEQSIIYKEFRNKYEISSNFIFNGGFIEFYGEGRIVCGEDSYIGSYSTVQAYNGTKVIIGKKCQISHNVRIYTNTTLADQDFSAESKLQRNEDVIIGDYVWIGANVFINPGVTIGNNSIVGANSVVTKDVLPFTIVGGVPAHLIRHKKID